MGGTFSQSQIKNRATVKNAKSKKIPRAKLYIVICSVVLLALILLELLVLLGFFTFNM